MEDGFSTHAAGPHAPTDRPGLAPNQAGALAYLLGAITGIIMLLIDRRPFVRFHALQCLALTVVGIGLSVALTVVGAALSVVPVLGVLVGLLASLLLGLAGFVLWILLMYRAYQGERWELPVVGPWALRTAETAPASAERAASADTAPSSGERSPDRAPSDVAASEPGDARGS